MRPVNKGVSTKTYTQYKDSRWDLFEKIGMYCSYCEMSLTNMPEIEHVVPVANGGNPLEWDNFLLSCKYCNTNKSNDNTSRVGYLWPDKDNTFLAFHYDKISGISASLTLSPTHKTYAENTIALFELNRDKAAVLKKDYSDTRWLQREMAWRAAERSYSNWCKSATLEMADTIAVAAKQGGFFSIWMEVFKGEKIVRQYLIKEYPGTEAACFDADTKPINRIGGQV